MHAPVALRKQAVQCYARRCCVLCGVQCFAVQQRLSFLLLTYFRALAKQAAAS